MKIRFLAGFVLIAARALAAAGPQVDLAILDKYKSLLKTMDRARAAFAAGETARCERDLDACLKSVPDHHEAHFFKAQIRYKEGDFARGAEHMAAAEEGFLSLAALIGEARSGRLMKDMDRGQALTDLIPELEKGYEDSMCKSNLWLAAKQDAENQIGELEKDKAERLRQRAAALPAEYLYFHGNCLFRLKKIPEAERLYRDALANEPAHGNANNNLINLLYGERRFADALAALEQAEAGKVAINPALKKAVLAADGR